MIPLQESAGDIKLYKLIIYKIPLIQGVDEDMYDNTVKAYLYIEPYTYNTSTRETDDRLITHYDMIQEVPKQIRRHEESLIQGKTRQTGSIIKFVFAYGQTVVFYLARIKHIYSD